MKQVEIPNDYFFRMACKDYYEWPKALIREFVQNSVDAGASEIRFSKEGDFLTVADNGCGMDIAVIEQALLTLGGSYKKDSASVGGLGKAKEILYFSWPEWEIITNGIWVKGQGCSYQIDAVKTGKGVTSRIKIANHIPNLEGVVKGYVNLCCLAKRVISWNKEALKNDAVCYGRQISSIEGLGDLYENLSGHKSQVIIQAHGLFMFSNYSVLDKGYIFNITTASYECLTANRDSFIGVWNDRFSRMIGKVAVDTESSLLRKEYILRVQNLKQQPLSTVSDESKPALQEVPISRGMGDQPPLMNELAASGYAVAEDLIDKATGKKLRTLIKAARTSKLFDACLAWYRESFPDGFIIVSEEDITSRIIQGLYARETLQLAILWKQVVDSIAQREGISRSYGYGIVIAQDTVARCQDRHILFNPRVFQPLAWDEAALKMLISASEELVHFGGCHYHNETFKCLFSDVVERALRERVYLGDLFACIRKVRKSGRDYIGQLNEVEPVIP